MTQLSRWIRLRHLLITSRWQVGCFLCLHRSLSSYFDLATEPGTLGCPGAASTAAHGGCEF